MKNEGANNSYYAELYSFFSKQLKAVESAVASSESPSPSPVALSPLTVPDADRRELWRKEENAPIESIVEDARSKWSTIRNRSPLSPPLTSFSQ